MKQRNKVLLFAAMLISGSCLMSQAQGLSGFLKKAQTAVEAVEKITKTDDNNKNTQKSSNGSTVTLPSGVTMFNPVAGQVDIDLVGVYVKPISENYGDAYVVLKVNPLIPETKIDFGSNAEYTMVAVGESGSLYKTSGAGIYPYDVIEGVPVAIKLKQNETVFKNVKRSDTMFAQMKVGIFIDYNHKGLITFKNVPLLWDQEPEM